MEELFIEDDEKKDDINNDDDIILSDEKEYNDEIVLNSFENINLEDFKKLAGQFNKSAQKQR